MKFGITILVLAMIAVPRYAEQEKQKADAAKRPDFSGRWILDVKKSAFGKGMPVEKIQEKIARKEGTDKENVSYADLNIEHREPELIVMEGQSDPSNRRGEIYFTDERGETNTISLVGLVNSKSKWDGKRLVTTVFRKTAPGKKSDTIVARTTWELSKDGNTLTKTVVPVDPAGGPQTRTSVVFASMTMKLVYRRAERIVK